MKKGAYRDFWVEAVRQLRAEKLIDEQEHSMWFTHIEFSTANEGLFVLKAESAFYSEQIKQRYLEVIVEKLSSLVGSPVSVKLEVDSNSKKKEEPAPAISFDTSVSHKKQRPLLREDYSFDSFVIGNNNVFAANASKEIASNPGSAYNPFLIYGGVGLGKTHLMQAIGNSIYKKFSDKKVIYITAEMFVSDFVQSIQNKKTNEFKNKYRKIDALLIDDIHDFQKKKETKEELFHTFNALYEAKKQLVFTCDRPPSELRDFADRLKNRFERGLTVDLEPPKFETRLAILKKKLELISTPISDNILEFIANNITSNVRDLEAALTKMVAYADLIGKELTVDIASQQLKNSFTSNFSVNITIDRVQNIVSDYFNVTKANLKGKRRTKVITFPRQIAMYIIREITDFSTTEIGLEFGGRDHTTVMHACQRIEDKMKGDPTLNPIISNLIRAVKERG